MSKYKIGDIIILREANELKNCQGIGNVPVDRFGGSRVTICDITTQERYVVFDEIEKRHWYFSDEMIEEKFQFNKDNLQSGDFAVQRDGRVQVFIKGKEYSAFICKTGGVNNEEMYTNDLKSILDTSSDIVKVYRPNDHLNCCFKRYESGELVFDEKNNSTTMTIKEIEERLGISNLKIAKE